MISIYLLNDKELEKKDRGRDGIFDEFFNMNDNSETNPEFIWESAKNYFRLLTISRRGLAIGKFRNFPVGWSCESWPFFPNPCII